MLLNPALAGSTGAGRIASVVKTIGTDIGDAYKVFNFSYDQMVNKIKSGIGIYLTGDDNGTGMFTSKRFGLNYALPFIISKAKKIKLAPAFELAYQLNKYNSTDTAITNNPNFKNKVSAIDLGAGFLVNSQRLNFGVVLKHLTQPNMSFYSKGENILGMRFSIITDYVMGKFEEKKTWKIAPGVRYSFQYGYSDLMLTLGATYHKFKFGAGFRYLFEGSSQNAASAQIAYNGLVVKFRYSYDFYTRQFAGTKPSSHEVTAAFNLFAKKKKDDFVASHHFAY